MVYRCRPNGPKNYGGRGIRVCDRWRGPGGFINFRNDMGERPPGTSIDRINNDGDYEPSNCRWATDLEQKQNTRKAVRLTWDGQTMTLAAWARQLGIGYSAIKMRHLKGWPADQILSPTSLQHSNAARARWRRGEGARRGESEP